jgi:hypothetical protein
MWGELAPLDSPGPDSPGHPLGVPRTPPALGVPQTPPAAPQERLRHGRRDPVKFARTAALLGVLAVVVLGGPFVDAALRAPLGAPVQVAPGVLLTPLSGWRLANPQRGQQPALLTRGSGNLAVLSVRGGAATALAAAYLRTYLEPASANLIASAPEPVPLGGTRLGVRVAYRGDFDGADHRGPLAGEVTTLPSPEGGGAVFDAWALPEVFDYERDDVRTMIERAELG